MKIDQKMSSHLGSADEAYSLEKLRAWFEERYRKKIRRGKTFFFSIDYVVQ
jgi:hypothetical protein